MSLIESFSMSYYTPLYENEQFESKIIQWRLLTYHTHLLLSRLRPTLCYLKHFVDEKTQKHMMNTRVNIAMVGNQWSKF